MSMWEEKYASYPLYFWLANGEHEEDMCEERTSWNDLRDHADRLMYYAEDLEEAILEIDDLDELRELQKQIKEFKEK